MIEPIDPVQRRIFDGVELPPWSAERDNAPSINAGLKAKKRSGSSPVLAVDLAPGIVRHTILCKVVARNCFRDIANEQSYGQANLLQGFVALYDTNPDAKAAVDLIVGRLQKPQLLRSAVRSNLKAALKKVGTRALEAFLKTQGAIQ